MNFVSKFDGSLAFTGTHPKAQLQVETVHTRAPSDAIVVKDANLLFNGDFKRTGLDLVISRDDQELVLPDYFKGDKRAALASSDGAYLTGKTIEVLTGHVQVAQADGSAAAAKIIGHVTKLSGSATVVRNGVSVVLNNGDTVYQGDVVQSGSNSTVGITFIDGSVFGLASNARMVLNEMVYDPNGSGNSSFLSLVQGTISFVAGATAKHGDMKVDTPVATMGIRGTAVLVEIDFEVTVPGTAPPARFQVLVEPDGTTGSYVLLDRVTLAPLATVSQPGTVTTVSGAGAVSFLASAQLSPELMKLISEVFSQKFTDNTNPKSNTNFTDTVIPQTTFPVQLAGGETVTATVTVIAASEGSGGPTISQPKAPDRIPGPPGVVTFNQLLAERPALTGSSLIDKVSGNVSYTDINPGDVPTVSTAFSSFGYASATGVNMTASLTATQLSAIAAVSVPLTVVQDPAAKNNGTATWTYNVQDHALDFLAQGEKLTLTYMARVDNNFAPANEFSFAPFTITITGTNDTPTIAGPAQTAEIEELEGEVDSDTLDTATGTIEFEDVDLTDTHSVSITGVVASGVVSGLPGTGGGPGAAAAPSNPLYWLSLGDFVDSTDGVTGSRVWTFSAEDHYFDYLAEGETLTLTYTVEVKDNNGATVTQDVVVTVTGTNDAPGLAIDTSGDDGLHSILELAGVTGDDTEDNASGSLDFRDVDLSDTHTVSASLPVFNWTNSYGQTLTVSQINGLTAASTFALTLHDSTGTGNGSIDFEYSAADYYFDFLAEGETLTITYEVTVLDEHSVASTQPVTITVTGSNDAPVAVADVGGGIVEAGHDANNDPVAGNATTTGNVLTNDTDVDITDTHTVVGVAAGTATSALSTGVGAAIEGVYGTLTLNEDGTWTYALNNDDPDTNALPEGAEVVDIFSYTQSDPHGATSTTTLTINIAGTNDEPVTNVAPVAATDTNEGTPVVEQGVNPGNTPFPGVASAEGNVLANDYDVDTGDTKTVQGVVSGTPTGPVSGQVGGVVVGTYGSLTLNADGTWTYALDNDNPATQGLAQGESVADVFTYTMHDELGSTSSATLSIAITGTNDAPVAVADIGGGVVEAGHDATNEPVAGNPTTTGNVLTNDTDVDITDTHTVVGVAAGTATSALSTGVGAAIEGVYGTLTLNEDGTWTYALNNDDPDTNALPEGAEVVDIFSYTQSDPYGATSTTTLTINITGTNDEPVANAAPAAAADENEGDPVVEAGVNPGNTAEPGLATANGNVLDNDYDVDNPDTKTVQSVSNGATSNSVAAGPTGTQIAGTYGTLTIFADGAWSYALDNDDPATQALTQGESVTDEFTYVMHDELGSTSSATLSIAITGTNDAPVVAAALTDAADEGDAVFTQNLLEGASDVDDDAILSVANVTYAVDGGDPLPTPPAGISRSGSTLTVDPGNPAFNHLAVDDTVTIVVTYDVTDEHGATVQQTETITITGTNDIPTVAAALTDAADEGSATFIQDLLEGASDLDDGETATLSISGVTYSVNGGTPSATAPAGVSLSGSTLTVDPTNPAFDHLAAGVTMAILVSYDVVDAQGATVAQTETITITGTNDLPTVAAALTDAADEGSATFTQDLLEGASDLDDGETATFSIGGVTYSVNSGTPSATAPAGVSLAGNILTVDPADPAFNHLAAGATMVIAVSYNVIDAQGATVAQTETITITGTNDAPAITSNGGNAAASVSVVENTTVVTTVEAGDVDDGSNLTYSIVTGDDSPDAALFTINPSTGALSFVDAPNYEEPGSAAGSNFYTVQVQVSDGAGGVDIQTLTVEVTDSGETLLANAETVFTNVDTPITLSTLTANDTSTGATEPQIVSVYNAKNGTVALNNGVPVFTPDPGFTGTASFSYWISETPDPTPPGALEGAVSYGMGAFPQAVTLADINDDGILDMLTSNYTSNTISFRYGNSDGSFDSSLHQLTAGANPSTPIVVADFNNDGNMDLAVGNFGSDNISIFYSNGNGGYNAAINYAAGDGPEGLTGADVNGDGNVDLIVSNYNAGTVAVTISNGNGTFQTPVEYAVGGSAGSLPYLSALADLDGDGNLDIVVGNAGSNNISVLLSDGDGTFDAAVNYAAPAGSNAVAIGDVNGDGVLDIVSSNGTVSVFLGNGDGTFQSQTSYAAGDRTKGIALADFDEDGDLDIVVANSRDPALDPNPQTNSVSILFNNGNGAFGAPVSYATGWDTYGVAVADLNGDGRPDIVAPNEIDGTASVLLNASPGGALSSTTVTVNVVQTAGPMQLVGHALLGGSGNQAASSVEYVNGHLYLAYNSMPQTQTASDTSTIVGFATGAGAPVQEFTELWTMGFFNGVAADGSHIYAAGASHPAAGLTHDGVGGAEVKTMLTIYDNPPTSAAEFTDDNFFGYGGVEIFQDVLATTQSGNTVLYAVGHGQPSSYGAYIIAAYDANGNLLHSAVDPLPVPGFSIAYEAVEFNGQIWAVGYTEHSGDPVGRSVVWAASYDLSTVVTYKNEIETNPASFNGAAVIGSNLYAVGYSVSASNGNQYLVAKYNSDGTIAWSTSFGGAGEDVLTGAVSINGRLYVVGYTTNASGNTDGVLMEISTVDGTVISTTSYGGALYDAFNSITTDGHYLYVAGESKSFTSGGNGAGEGDAILLTFDPGLGPEINTEAFSVAEIGNTSTVTGLSITTTAAGADYTVTVEAGAPGSSVTPSSASGTLAQINSALETTGLTYDPGTGAPETDIVTFTVTDDLGNSDIVNFIFNEAGTGPIVTLTGTAEKDVIFATGYDDMLTGGAKADQFVFTPEDSPSEDIIMDFTLGEDRIDLRAFTGLDTSNIEDWLEENVSQDGSDTVITLDDDTTITLTNVSATSLSASNFIVSQYQQLGM